VKWENFDFGLSSGKAYPQTFFLNQVSFTYKFSKSMSSGSSPLFSAYFIALFSAFVSFVFGF